MMDGLAFGAKSTGSPRAEVICELDSTPCRNFPMSVAHTQLHKRAIFCSLSSPDVLFAFAGGAGHSAPIEWSKIVLNKPGGKVFQAAMPVVGAKARAS